MKVVASAFPTSVVSVSTAVTATVAAAAAAAAAAGERVRIRGFLSEVSRFGCPA